MQKIDITGYYADNENFVLASNQNPETFFNSKASADKLFISMKELIQPF